MFLFLVVALLVVLGIALVGWFRPLPNNKPQSPTTHTDQQVAAAKASICAAYQQVRRALVVAGARNGGSDPTASLAVATASRQALDVGSRYLLTKLAEEPATNPDLATAVRKLADLYQQIMVSYLADANDSEINPLRQAAEQPTATNNGLCK
jgi:phage tail sheath gpL-like